MTTNPPSPGDNKIDYKNTVNLPQTDFPMKANLAQKEPEMIKQWEEKGIYGKMLAKNEGKTSFVMPDGPPYANGSIHIGHHLNKTLKDIVIKYWNMAGKYAPFIPGWDCHGLPIEHAVIKNLGANAKDKSNDEIRKLCRQEAKKWVDHQMGQFRRLGVLADWQHPYLTMDAGFEAEEIREFARAYEKGVIYLGVKPVYWNWLLQTALADAEVEYHMHKSPSIYVKFEVKDPGTLTKLGNPKKKTSFVIWTTTPWTLPANLGIALNPDFDYGVYESGEENLILAEKLHESFAKENNLSLLKKFGFKGSDLERGLAQHPWLPRTSLIVLGSHVTLEAGTGCVHTAPGHGADDYKVGLKYGLDILSPVNESGLFTKDVAEFAGLHIFKANPLIIEKLRTSGHLISAKEIEHSYPHCWRSKVPLFFRATPQWFIGLDMEGSQIRKKTLQALSDVRFFPGWGEARLRSMMEGRPDWCLSRQRIWGVPIPIFYCKRTEKPLADLKVMMKVADVVEKDGGIDAFYRFPPEHFIGDLKAATQKMSGGDSEFGADGFVHGKDILDVWFDSGIVHAAIQKRTKGMSVPADIYLEGSDQHRGWFNTSLLSSMVTNGKPPFKALITHGFVNDAQGMKMSKSKGNTIDPIEVAAKNGIEPLRLWTVYEDYGQDLSIGPQTIERVSESYRKIRNTLRYMLGANFDFDPAQHMVPYDKLTDIDKWALSRLYHLTVNMTQAYEEYTFYKIFHSLNLFFTVDLSNTYLDILKDRLYTWKKDGPARRSSQTVIHLMTDYLVRLMAPVLSFLSEEVYSYMKNRSVESVFLLSMPKAPAEWNNAAVQKQFETLLPIRAEVQKELEVLRTQKTIGASLEATVRLQQDGEIYQTLENFKGLREFLIVSEVQVDKGPAKVHAEKAEGEKCVRCWVYSTEIGSKKELPGVCPKCVEALQ